MMVDTALQCRDHQLGLGRAHLNTTISRMWTADVGRMLALLLGVDVAPGISRHLFTKLHITCRQVSHGIKKRVAVWKVNLKRRWQTPMPTRASAHDFSGAAKVACPFAGCHRG